MYGKYKGGVERTHGFGWDPLGKRPFVCPTCTWEGNIGVDFTENGMAWTVNQTSERLLCIR